MYIYVIVGPGPPAPFQYLYPHLPVGLGGCCFAALHTYACHRCGFGWQLGCCSHTTATARLTAASPRPTAATAHPTAATARPAVATARPIAATGQNHVLSIDFHDILKPGGTNNKTNMYIHICIHIYICTFIYICAYVYIYLCIPSYAVEKEVNVCFERSASASSV